MLFPHFVMLGLLQVTVLGGTFLTLVSAVLAFFLGTSMGLFMSAFANSEFQAIQFGCPALILPQLLTCGLFVARDRIARPLQWFADVMPLTYSVDAMKQITIKPAWTGELTRDLIVVAGFGIGAYTWLYHDPPAGIAGGSCLKIRLCSIITSVLIAEYGGCSSVG